ncbi:sugar ABC transporter substrate-binding protein [Nocardioides bruguierae]|uniref:Sugar ABC transporter substrate-binding protein n=1 Tax=Nocardioides bruguierae TaxID=2945102 RepID=A0A9X2IHZ3_9ACTN|nr:sugar ABC transporter substrate-binding protein [Nocardioides bruguierae]MCM0622300.1 sugar ABC transporter substrate-binding protein [Nocardioides bruguierae]
MNVRTRAVAALATLALVPALAACNSQPVGSATADDDLTIAVITHGDGGSFWSVVKTGAEAAASAEGVTLNYQESDDDPEQQAQLIEAAVTAGVDGIAVSAPNPDAIRSAVADAVDAGIPVITLNSGSGAFDELGAITHVGQDEKIAGEGAGEQLAEAGATKVLCVIHEQSNTGLQDRCDGAAEGFTGEVEDFQVAGKSDPTQTSAQIAAKLQADGDVDAVLALDPDIAVAALEARDTAGSDALLATFDLSSDVVTAIEDGDILFAVDQQQYLQGYLPVVALALYDRNLNTIGGGQPILTGPGFVTQDNAAEVADLADEGTR